MMERIILWALLITVLCIPQKSVVMGALPGLGNLMHGKGSSRDAGDNGRPVGQSLQREREALYDAYNLLHTLAQDFHKPFDSPAVIVVGHQTSGKSALIEALMGFQFNQVKMEA